MSNLLFQKLVGTVEGVKGFQKISIPLLGKIPVIGEIFFNHNALVYLHFCLCRCLVRLEQDHAWLEDPGSGREPRSSGLAGS